MRQLRLLAPRCRDRLLGHGTEGLPLARRRCFRCRDVRRGRHGPDFHRRRNRIGQKFKEVSIHVPECCGAPRGTDLDFEDTVSRWRRLSGSCEQLKARSPAHFWRAMKQIAQQGSPPTEGPRLCLHGRRPGDREEEDADRGLDRVVRHRQPSSPVTPAASGAIALAEKAHSGSAPGRGRVRGPLRREHFCLPTVSASARRGVSSGAVPAVGLIPIASNRAAIRRRAAGTGAPAGQR